MLQPECAALIRMVTRSGKALALCASLHALQTRNALPAKIGVFTSRVRLVRDLLAALWRVLDPAARAFSAAVLDANRGWGTREVQATRRLSRIVGRLGSGAQVEVGAYPSLKGQRFDLLICDEAHRTKGERVRKIVEAHPRRVGWTATPHGRDDRDGLPFSDLVYDFPYQDAVDAGVIVPWERVENTEAIPYDGDGIEAAGRLLPVALRMIADKGGPATIGPILFTAPNLTVAAWMAEQIRARGWTAEAAIPRRRKGDPGMSRRQIDRLLTRFEQGEIGCLVTVDLLAEGVTIPNLRAVALCCAPRGRNHLCQIAGRAMGTCAPDRWGEKTTALLFDPACILRAFKLEHPAAMGRALEGRPKSLKRAAKEGVAELVALPWAQRVTAMERWSGAIRLASERLRADMGKRRELAIAERALPATEKEVRRLRGLAGLVRYVQPEAHREAVRAAVEAEGLPCGVVDDLAYALARVAKARGEMKGAPFWRLAQVVVRVPEGVGLPGLGVA